MGLGYNPEETFVYVLKMMLLLMHLRSIFYAEPTQLVESAHTHTHFPKHVPPNPLNSNIVFDSEPFEN